MGFTKLKSIKKLCRKGTALGLAGALSLACMGTNSMAAATGSDAHGAAGDVAAWGCVSTNSAAASATTSCNRAGVYMYAKAPVYYMWGDTSYYTVADNSATCGGIGTTAGVAKNGARVYGGTGYHKVVNGSTWTGDTITGRKLKGAKRI